MTAPVTVSDAPIRRQAILDINTCCLVEAGAGAGKTSVLAGHVVALLVSGVDPKAIAAVTFTELAASELLERIERYVREMAAGRIPKELQCAWPGPLQGQDLINLQAALPKLDEIVCTTIHGFCQRLISPYPAEANIDPGATLLDRTEAVSLFEDTVDRWLHAGLQVGGSALLAEMVRVDATKATKTVTSVANALRREPTAQTNPAGNFAAPFQAFIAQVAAYAQAYNSYGVHEAGIEDDLRALEETANRVQAALALSELGRTVSLAAIQLHPDLLTTDGEFRKLQAKTAFGKAAPNHAKSKAGAEAYFASSILPARDACLQPFEIGRAEAAQALLALLVPEVRNAVQTYADVKRERALLDFDGLIRSARTLLRSKPDVRKHLGERFLRILVDEFQDTDPQQSEIFWLLAGDPPAGQGEDAAWDAFVPRAGSIFLVGDPKQGIYRFRGADIAAYDRAKQALLAMGGVVLPISSNFRSCKSVLDFVNENFEKPLTPHPQPGFQALQHTINDGPGLCVATLKVDVPDKAKADVVRDIEGEEVAKLCAALIGQFDIRIDGETTRKCQPSDIALLAPAGTDLWRYEGKLEDWGIPVVTQAGKGFFWRQEVQDLIALSRAISDRRDTIALAAFLRGPMVGLTERELLDLATANGGKLRLGVDYSSLPESYAKEMIGRLDLLSRKARSKTPYEVLSLAVEMFNIRAHLLRRHQFQADRSLANLDSFLEQSRAWSGRGLKAYATAMADAWATTSARAKAAPTRRRRPSASSRCIRPRAWNGRLSSS